MLARWPGLILLALSACVRLNEDHCANQDAPSDYCYAKHEALFCSKCEAQRDGCVMTLDEIDPGCRPDDATSAADDGSTGGSATAATSETTTGDDATSSMTSDADGSSGSGDTGIPEPECGNGILEPENGENCDGEQFQHTDCGEINLGKGTLACNPKGSPEECKYNFDACSSDVFECGDGDIEGTEQCEPPDNVGGATCQSLSENYIGGQLTCSETCEFNTTNCEMCHLNNEPCETPEDCCGGTCLNVLGNKSCALG